MYVDFLLHTCESVHCVLQNDRERGVTWSYIRYVTIHREGWIQYLKSPKARPGETQWPPSWLFYTAKLLRWRWHRWDAGLNSCHSDQNQVQVAILDSDWQCKNMQKHQPNHLHQRFKLQFDLLKPSSQVHTHEAWIKLHFVKQFDFAKRYMKSTAVSITYLLSPISYDMLKAPPCPPPPPPPKFRTRASDFSQKENARALSKDLYNVASQTFFQCRSQPWLQLSSLVKSCNAQQPLRKVLNIYRINVYTNIAPSHDTTESRKYQLASRPAIKSWTCPIISAANGLTDTGSPHLKFKGWLDSSSFCHMLYICCTGYRYHSSLWLYMTINHYNLDAHMVTKPSIHSGSKAAKHEHSRYLDATSSMPRILLILTLTLTLSLSKLTYHHPCISSGSCCKLPSGRHRLHDQVVERVWGPWWQRWWNWRAIDVDQWHQHALWYMMHHNKTYCNRLLP